MNNGNSIEKMQTNKKASDDLNLRRRRFIRGTVGIAPMVLTLRSGAVAAGASCTPIKELVTVQDKKFNPISTDIITGDICVKNVTTDSCGERAIIDGDFAGKVEKKVNGSGITTYKCKDAPNGQIAIISGLGGAAVSILGYDV